MSNNLVELFKNSINKKNVISANENKIFLDEKKYEYIFPNNHAYICFTLDNNKNRTKNNFPFFADRPPRGIEKMCDEMVIIFKKNKNYIFCIERKSGKNTEGYKKQIINGKHFCNWIINLLKEHKHFVGDYKEIKFQYILLIDKKATSKRNKQSNKKELKKDEFIKEINRITFSQFL